jgi:hypothetical protein
MPVSLEKSSAVAAADKKELLLQLLRFRAAEERAFGRSTALLKYGRVYPHVEQRPPALPMGQMGLCYCNCTRARYPYLAHDPVPFHYAEGYALDGETHSLYEHAWLVDLNGRAIDLTWTDTTNVVYFGVTFTDEFVHEAIMATKLFGILCSAPLQSRLFANSAAFESTLWRPPLPGLPVGRLRKA